MVPPCLRRSEEQIIETPIIIAMMISASGVIRLKEPHTETFVNSNRTNYTMKVKLVKRAAKKIKNNAHVSLNQT
jgi:uncharacterized protein YccT (UPF0319 family)